ncbi:GTPase NRas precursor [Lasiosphaeria ovina]|uniref:GTPase NRas n=1 Tax=Lasiosphaeria ovina TaxID=92902 RepID=A0AAE0JTM7_9PEZI|nr:GTPase NRas precursor [Lasiosphaeria ovina]
MDSYKLVVLGDESVGKTQLTTQFCLETFDETYYPTIENSYRKQWLVDGEFCMLKIVDTAGQEQYNALRGEWIRDGEVFIIVYSITSRTTFQRVRLFHIQVSRGIESLLYRGELLLMPIIIVGNMCDRAAEREVMTQEGEALAKELGCDFVEASAKTGTNVDRAFCDAVRRVRWHREQQRGGHPPPSACTRRCTARSRRRRSRRPSRGRFRGTRRRCPCLRGWQ